MDGVRRKRLFVRTLVALASVAVALVCCEFALRLFVGPYYAGVYRIHDAWLFEHVPGARRIERVRLDGSDRLVEFDVNSDGFRGPELRPAGAAKRVMVYGDSFVAAKATPYDETFVARLGRRVADALGADVEAVNAGVVGYGPDQELLRMESDLPVFRPDLVVVALCAENDYGDLVRDRLFELDENGALARRRPAIPQNVRDAYAAARSGLVLTKLVRKTIDGFGASGRATGESVGDAYGPEEELEDCAFEHQTAVVERNPDVMWRIDHPDADVRLEPDSASARHKIRLMSAVLEAMRDAARARGVPLLFVVVPSAPDVCARYDRDVADARQWPHYRPENLTEPLERICGALGAPCVGLFAPFRARGADALYFHGGDTHWNSDGQALAAELAAPQAAALLRGK